MPRTAPRAPPCKRSAAFWPAQEGVLGDHMPPSISSQAVRRFLPSKTVVPQMCRLVSAKGQCRQSRKCRLATANLGRQRWPVFRPIWSRAKGLFQAVGCRQQAHHFPRIRRRPNRAKFIQTTLIPGIGGLCSPFETRINPTPHSSHRERSL